MRKPTYLFLFLVLVLALSACGGGGAVDETPGLGGATPAPGGIGGETLAPGGVETEEPGGVGTGTTPTVGDGAGGMETPTAGETEAGEATPTEEQAAATQQPTATTADGAGGVSGTETPGAGDEVGTGTPAPGVGIVGTATPAIPVTGAAQFVLVSDLLTYPVVMAEAVGAGGAGGAATGTPSAGDMDVTGTPSDGDGTETGTPAAGEGMTTETPATGGTGGAGQVEGSLGMVEDIILSVGGSLMGRGQEGGAGGVATSTPGADDMEETGTPSTGGLEATTTPAAGGEGGAGVVDGARVLYLVVNADESFGFGEQSLVAIPWEHVQIDHEQQVVMVDITQEEFESAPTFSSVDWPDMTQPDWDQEWRDFWSR